MSWDDRKEGELDDDLQVSDETTGMIEPIFRPGTARISGICGGCVAWSTSMSRRRGCPLASCGRFSVWTDRRDIRPLTDREHG